MRKTVALLLACLMLFAVCAGCGKDKGPDSSSFPSVDNSTVFPDSSDLSEPVSDPNEPASTDTTTTQKQQNSGGTTPNGNANGNTTTTTKNNLSNKGSVAVTNLTWDVMKGLGGAEAQAVSMRQSIVNAKDSLSVSGTKYYFSESGSDTNDGKSANSPLKSLDRISRLPLKAGDAVLLERGSVFRIDSQINLVSGVSYGAYGSGNKPEIWCSAKNYNEGWTKHSGNIWKIAYQYSNAGQLVADDGKLVGNKVFSLNSVKKSGDFYCDDQGTLYLCSSKNPNTYKDIEIACPTSMMGGDSLSNITIENLTLKYAGCHGVGISNGRGVTVRNCVFGWIGGMVQRPGTGDNTRLGNAIEFFNNGNDLKIQNNWIYEAYDTGFTFQGTVGPFENIYVGGNLMEYCVMTIEMWCNDHDTPISATIENNVLRFANYGWGTMPDRIVRGGHIWMTWRLGDPYTNLKIAMNNNVFDCSYSYIFSYPWRKPTKGTMEFTYSGNVYYQRNHLGAADKVHFGSKKNWAFYWGENAITVEANNQAELEAAVKAVDPNAKTIQWLG